MFKFNWYNKFGIIPSSYREAMSYEEQILWLCQQIENLKLESGNYNYNMLENKPSINGVTLEGNINATQLGLDNYNYLLNKPAINGVTLAGNKSLTDLGIQGKLTAGTGIRIVGNTISATGGGSGGTSDYRDLEHKPSINGFTLVGNSTAKELKLQDLLEVDRSQEVYHNTNYGKIANIANFQINDTIPLDIPTTDYDHACYLVYNVGKGSYFDLYGNYDLYKVDNGNKLQLTYSTNNEVEHGYFEALSGGYIIINFFDIGDYNAEIKEYFSGEGINQDFENVNKNLNAYKYDLDILLKNNFNYENLLTNAQEGLFIGMSEDAPLPAPIEDSTSRYVKIATASDYSSIFRVVGECNGSYMWFTTENRNGTEYLISHSEMNIIINSGLGVEIPFEADYIYFQFTNFNASINSLQGLKITEISGGGASVNKLTSNLVLLPSTPLTLNTGFYQTVSDINNFYGVYYHSATASNLILGGNELFYFDNASQTLIFENKNYFYEDSEADWAVQEHTNITNEIVNDRSKIPTSQAVYNAIQNGNNYYTTLTSSLTFNMDGTNSANLTEGYYYLDSNVYYYSNGTLTSASFMLHTICYFSASLNEFYIAGNSRAYNRINYRLEYVDSTEGWTLKELKTSDLLKTSDIVTSISEYSLDSQVPSAKAVYDTVNNVSICQIGNTSRIYCNVTQAWSPSIVPLDEQKISSSDYTFVSNKIIVGSKPKMAEISFNCLCDTMPTANYNFTINLKRNNINTILYSSSFKTISGMDVANFFGLTYYELQEGDEIYLNYTANSAVNFYIALNAGLTVRTLSYN